MRIHLSTVLKPYLPKSLLGRSVLIIVMPLILLQVVSATIFFENHWSKVGRRLALGVAGEIALVIDEMRRVDNAQELNDLFEQAHISLRMEITYNPGGVLPDTAKRGEEILVSQMTGAMDEVVKKPHRIDAESSDRDVEIDVQLADGVLSVQVPRKRLFSTTTYVFVLWMVGTSMLLFSVAMVFMRNQVRPIRRLASAADDFGKGRDTPRFKPEGSTEVRRAAAAFISMRNRIKRQIQQRTDMLAGVSHDLRTPLTRMKLQLEMMGDDAGVTDLKSDISDMEHMLEEYLAFARGEGGGERGRDQPHRHAPRHREPGPAQGRGHRPALRRRSDCGDQAQRFEARVDQLGGKLAALRHPHFHARGAARRNRGNRRRRRRPRHPRRQTRRRVQAVFPHG